MLFFVNLSLLVSFFRPSQGTQKIKENFSSMRTKDVLEGKTKKLPLPQFYLPPPDTPRESNDTVVELSVKKFDLSSYELSQTNIKIYLFPLIF